MAKKRKKSNSIYFVPEPGVPQGGDREFATCTLDDSRNDDLLLSLEAYRERYKDSSKIDPSLLLRHLKRQVDNINKNLSTQEKQRRVDFWENQYVTCVLNGQDPDGIY